MKSDYDIIVIGAGLVGLASALCCARHGFSVLVLDARDLSQARDDGRASTLAASSYVMLKNLGLTERLSGELEPITDMMIGEGLPGRISPLTLHFDGDEQRDRPMAYIGSNMALHKVMLEVAGSHEAITLRAPGTVIEASFDGGQAASVTLASGETLSALILIAADGRNSTMRKRAAIACVRQRYDQSALVCTVRFDSDMGGVAQQMFLPGGPMAVLPMTQRRANIVWSDTPSAIEVAIGLDRAGLTAELTRRIGDNWGEIDLLGAPQSYPLMLQMAETYSQGRLALVGDAAHVIHPLAGQGLNLGLRDAAALSQSLEQSRGLGLDLTTGFNDYGLWRRADNRAMAGATEGLNRLFSNRITPVGHLRRLGLTAIDKLPLARNFLMREAAGEIGNLPEIMRA